MPCLHPFPTRDAIRQLLGDMLGRELQVAAGPALTIEPQPVGVAADYSTDEGALAAMCVADVRLSNVLGAALTMVASSSVDAAVQRGVVDEANYNNLTEVVKAMERLFQHDDCAPVRWRGVHLLPGDVPTDDTEMLAKPSARRDYTVTVDEYGAGTLAVLVR